MPNVGYSTTPTYGWFEEGLNTGNQVSTLFTMPASGGYLTTLHVYAATYSGSCKPWLCVWNGNNVLLGYAQASTTVSAGAPAWVTATLGTPIYVAGGDPLFIGFACPNANGFYCKYDSNASHSINASLDTTPPGNQTSHTNYASRVMGAYAAYTIPPTLQIRRSGAWVAHNVAIRRSGAWVAPSAIKVRRSGAWVTIA